MRVLYRTENDSNLIEALRLTYHLDRLHISQADEEGHQVVSNASKKLRIRRRASADPLTIT